MVQICRSATSIRTISLKRSIYATVYQDVLDYFFIPYTEDKFGEKRGIFQFDLAQHSTIYKRMVPREEGISSWLARKWHRCKYERKSMVNPQDNIKKILSIKLWRTEVSNFSVNCYQIIYIHRIDILLRVNCQKSNKFEKIWKLFANTWIFYFSELL